MADNDRSKHFRDPLLSQLDDLRAERSREKPDVAGTPPARHGFSPALYGLAALLLVFLGVLGYYLLQARQEIAVLSTELSTSREQLGEVSSTLQESQGRIEELNQGLSESQKKLGSQASELHRYKGLYDGLKDDQENQTREIEALHVQKADQSDVSGLKEETGRLKSRLGETDSQLGQTRTEVQRLDAQSKEHSEAISRNRTELAAVKSNSEKNAADIGEIRRSLEREYYNFELQEGGGYMKVFSVSLSLKDTDFEKRQFDLYVMADGKVIRKKDQSINEPILFYAEGKTKPYEVVVTRVEKKLVVGYLSVPKS